MKNRRTQIIGKTTPSHAAKTAAAKAIASARARIADVIVVVEFLECGVQVSPRRGRMADAVRDLAALGVVSIEDRSGEPLRFDLIGGRL